MHLPQHTGRLPGDQMEIPPACATQGRKPNELEIHGEGKEALDNPDLLMPPSSVAASYWQLYQQPRSAWTFELEIRPFGEKW